MTTNDRNPPEPELRLAQGETPGTLDPVLEAVSRGLDLVADQERRGAPAGLEERVVAATLGTLREAAAAGREVIPMPVVRATRTTAWSLRMAAAVGLVATIGAALLAERGPSKELERQALSETDWALVTSMLDDASSTLDDLRSETMDLNDRIRTWSLGDVLLDEGSM